MKPTIFLLACLFVLPSYTDPGNDLFKAKAKTGDGIFSLLRRYDLLGSSCNIDHFYNLNNLHQGAQLLAGKEYAMPIYVFKYNGKSIRTTIGNDDWDNAVRIQKFNQDLVSTGVKSKNYTEDKILLVPFHLLGCSEPTNAQPAALKVTSKVYPLFGSKYENVIIKSDRLKDKVYYVVSGHGGPDTGAMGIMGFSNKLKASLVEDEYAYDVSLRLARRLIEEGGTVHIIIQDKNDGIRELEVLPKDYDEVCYNGEVIPRNHIARLSQRTNVVNSLYLKHKAENKKEQVMVSIHVDSRPNINQRVDVYFYHHERSRNGKAYAKNLQRTFKEKYAQYQAGRTYSGTFTPRSNLYVIKNTLPTAVYVELANINNAEDQKRIMIPRNRQYLADWLFEGLTKPID